MTDAELLAKKLAALETYVGELRSLGRIEDIAEDVVQQRFLLYTLQIGRRGWIEHDLAHSLAQMVGMRNLLVHEYAKLDLDKVRSTLRDDLDDLLAFAESIRRRLAAG